MLPPEVPSLMGTDWLPALSLGNAMVALALAVLVASACKTAMTVTVFGVGKAAGEVYIPLALMVPTVALPPATPFTLQFATCGVAVPAFERNAVNCCGWLMGTVAELGTM